MKIAVVSTGRFHLFHLVRELVRQGEDVTFFTPYPKFFVQRFGIPRKNIHSFPLYGVLIRITQFLTQKFNFLPCQFFFRFLFQKISFYKWIKPKLLKTRWDILHVYGFLPQVLEIGRNSAEVVLIAQGTSHLREKISLVQGAREEIIRRVEKAYELASGVILLSTYAKQTFLKAGFPEEKIRVLPLGVEVQKFRPERFVIEERIRRILARERLRIASLTAGLFEFRFVGSVLQKTKALAKQSRPLIEFVPRQPESRLPSFYAWADLYVFTTLDDGFGAVLCQAQAAGLPILATSHCGAPDIIQEDRNGWVLPVQNPLAFVERLWWCDTHRAELAQRVREIYDHFIPRDWADAAKDAVSIYRDFLSCPQRAKTP